MFTYKYVRCDQIHGSSCEADSEKKGNLNIVLHCYITICHRYQCLPFTPFFLLDK